MQPAGEASINDEQNQSHQVTLEEATTIEQKERRASGLSQIQATGREVSDRGSLDIRLSSRRRVILLRMSGRATGARGGGARRCDGARCPRRGSLSLPLSWLKRFGLESF